MHSPVARSHVELVQSAAVWQRGKHTPLTASFRSSAQMYSARQVVLMAPRMHALRHAEVGLPSESVPTLMQRAPVPQSMSVEHAPEQ